MGKCNCRWRGNVIVVEHSPGRAPRELDATFLHLYGISEADADYILETFPIVKAKDVEHFGTYRTKELILERYRTNSLPASRGQDRATQGPQIRFGRTEHFGRTEGKNRFAASKGQGVDEAEQ